MPKILKKVDIFSGCRDIDLSIWSCPNFLFILVGIVDAGVTILVYNIAKHWGDPIAVFAGLSAINILILLIGGIIVNAQERILIASKAKAEFVSIASHQLRAPIGNMRWAIEILEGARLGGLSGKQCDYLTIIKENNDRMLKLVNDLLGVSHISEGKMKVAPKIFDFGDIVKQAVARCDNFAKTRGADISVEVEENIPPAFADPEKIKIVLDNLLDNAIKYSKKSGGRIKVNLKTLKSNALFEIEDNGVGIPKHQHKKVFDKFFRSDNVLRREVIGTGLGLYITKAIVESNGGKIWFCSQEEKGTKFSFIIPLAGSLAEK